VLLFPTLVFAQSPAIPSDYQPPEWPGAPSANQLLVRLGLLTLGVLACAAVVLVYARRNLAAQTTQPNGQAPTVVASVPLAGRCALHLLQVEQTGFVVATDPGGLKAVHLLPESFDELVEVQLAPPAVKDEILDCPLAPKRLSA
jgi:hypothetical protein